MSDPLTYILVQCIIWLALFLALLIIAGVVLLVLLYLTGFVLELLEKIDKRKNNEF